MASSDLCVNSSDASVGDCFWSNDVSQGISVSPKQLIFLNPFISFPQPAGHVPFQSKAVDGFETDGDDVIYALIEADLLPLFNHPVPSLEVICRCHKFRRVVKLRHNQNTNSVRDSIIYDFIRCRD